MKKKKTLLQHFKKIISFDDDDSFFDDEPIEDELKTQPVYESQHSFFEHKKNPILESDLYSKVEYIPEQTTAELPVDVYQTDTQIIVQAVVAGIKPESLSVSITRDSVSISGKRDDTRKIDREKFYIKELYFGAFERVFELEEEIEPDQAEATEKFGLLTLKLPKVDRTKKTNIKVKAT